MPSSWIGSFLVYGSFWVNAVLLISWWRKSSYVSVWARAPGFQLDDLRSPGIQVFVGLWTMGWLQPSKRNSCTYHLTFSNNCWESMLPNVSQINCTVWQIMREGQKKHVPCTSLAVDLCSHTSKMSTLVKLDWNSLPLKRINKENK